MNNGMLRLREVNLFRSQRRVLAGVTFDVARGELVALMGPSGVGKTTVLRVIAGLETFQSGTVHVEELALNGGNGHAPATLQQLRAKVGMVFQFHHLFEHLSVLKNVWLAPVYARGMPSARPNCARANCSPSSASSIVPPPSLASFPAAKHSASPSPAPLPSTPRFYFWTSPLRR